MKAIIELTSRSGNTKPHLLIEPATGDTGGIYLRTPSTGYAILTQEQAKELATAIKYLIDKEQ